MGSSERRFTDPVPWIATSSGVAREPILNRLQPLEQRGAFAPDFSFADPVCPL